MQSIKTGVVTQLDHRFPFRFVKIEAKMSLVSEQKRGLQPLNPSGSTTDLTLLEIPMSHLHVLRFFSFLFKALVHTQPSIIVYFKAKAGF